MATEQARSLRSFSPKLSAARAPGRRPPNQEPLYSSLATSSSTEAAILTSLEALHDASPNSSASLVPQGSDDDSSELAAAVLVKSAVATLSLTMDKVLAEALEAERELDWWRSIENSRWSTMYFLLQSTHCISFRCTASYRSSDPVCRHPASPIRVARLANDVANIAKQNQVPLSFSNLNRETFRLRISPHLEVFSSLFPSFSRHQSLTNINKFYPSELARQECKAHRKELEAIRDLRAQQLGQLSFLGTTVVAALTEAEETSFSKASSGTPSELHDRYTSLAQLLATSMENILSDNGGLTSPFEKIESQSLDFSPNFAASSLQSFLKTSLPSHTANHDSSFVTHRRPGKWILEWPRLVLIPPLLLLAARSAYHNRDTISSNLRDAGETIRGFWVQWVLEPVADILKTVRTGGDDTAGRVISKDGLKSDMDVRDLSRHFYLLLY